MIHIILVDSELELVPGSDEVFDRYLHRELAEKLGTRRGRPDIVHAFLCLCQSSIANRQGRIRTWVHTRNDILIKVDRTAKVPPHYLEFLDLMHHILSGGKEKGFIRRKEGLRQIIRDIDPDSIVALTPEGESTSLRNLLENEKEVAVLIGGFPEGDYLSSVYDLATLRVSLGSDLLTVWTVTCEVLSSIPK